MKRDEQYILGWEQAFVSGVEHCGGKGWNLSRMARYGFKVPKGGIITAAAFILFVEENGLAQQLRDVSESFRSTGNDELALAQKLDSLKKSFFTARVPEPVVTQVSHFLAQLDITDKPLAIRSSASGEDSPKASFAGIHDSFLNVQGLDKILSAIKRCYASLWSMRALAYRQKMGFADQEVLPSVVIMEMVDAKSSGVGFSCNPQSGRLDQIVIEANFGLGESIVGGSTEPDQYIVNYNLELIEKKIGHKLFVTIAREDGETQLVPIPQSLNPDGQVLSDPEIIELSVLIARVYKALGEGEVQQDVEWAFNGKHFFILQARPVTGQASYTYPILKDQPDIWSNGNFKDTCPMVFSAFLHRPMISAINNLLAVVPKELGYPALEGRQYCRFFAGRIYLNIALLQWEYYDILGFSPAETNAQVGGHQEEIQVPRLTGRQRLATTVNKLKMFRLMLRVRKDAQQLFRGVRQWGKELLEKDLLALNDREMVKALITINTEVEPFVKIGLLNSNAVMLMDTVVNALKRDYGEKAWAIANSLLVGKAKLPSAEQGYRLIELAETAHGDRSARKYFASQPFQPLAWETLLPEDSVFKRMFKEYLAEFGHRAVYEVDWENPRWREDPTYLLEYIKEIMVSADLGKFKAEQQTKSEQGELLYKKKVPLYRRWRINWLLRQAIRGIELREEGKSEMARLVEPSRYITLCIGQRLKKRGLIAEINDVFHCSFPDIFAMLLGYWDGTGIRTLIGDRKQRKIELEQLEPPDLIINGKANNAPAIPVGEGNVLSGLGVASGRAQGKARLLYRPEEGIGQGDVLVAPSTDPGWTPLFLKAAGIVMETGGFLSHGATVAREYGIPAVVNVPGAMKFIKDGDELIVDGDLGKVFKA
ncbi:phosphoenolpyruvate synthase/pyruvate phosphate dikinase [Desulfosporosinus orientis DSM 765]|uniref:Phosphoenolpyruvate synthase/pyruvate phosphate dikinase n=1 Tax=Desulfosporosinus orientis (strain ATCC 19365 / DSM 765 / NCIMB 8382 / VKM B-1628 / Singapore I) TaxID=768706 RepID=G7W8N1_DESOD|nr:PEP/pyruvate-binding domain-containing protein [Desulfosporosinus orientis]AET67458.1 phosphoenolpyruvate synthase/pyruvate phosphate dikinase [Desulfosporosinus orientis DSM 765]